MAQSEVEASRAGHRCRQLRPEASVAGQGWLIEDDGNRARRRSPQGDGRAVRRVLVSGHSIEGPRFRPIGQRVYTVGQVRRRGETRSRAELALAIVDSALLDSRPKIVVAGSHYGSSAGFLDGLEERGLPYAVELRPGTVMSAASPTASRDSVTAADLVATASWTEIHVDSPVARRRVPHSAAELGDVTVRGRRGRLVGFQAGLITQLHRGIVIVLTSSPASLAGLVQSAGWVRWIRPTVRRQEQGGRAAEHAVSVGPTAIVKPRANIALAEAHDRRAATLRRDAVTAQRSCRRILTRADDTLNVVELFAGGGGMGLGFLNAAQGQHRYRLICSAELNPIYVETLKRNHRHLDDDGGLDNSRVPTDTRAVDLRTKAGADLVDSCAADFGPVHVLLGGPPCQGFSNANRNSWDSANPNNSLVGVFVDYVQRLRPLVFLMENVQGILWTARAGSRGKSVSAASNAVRQFERDGYIVFPRLLDAVWYGVPQFRSRLFILGIRKDLGYRKGDFGEWGPFPAPTHGPSTEHPYTTVREAIGDLPKIGNGHRVAELRDVEGRVASGGQYWQSMRSGAPDGVVLDHVTSRHAGYVIERYRQIPPGGNWRSIVHTMGNYAAPERTHSNIYHRLWWDRPAITIGHYRKSMLVHPEQHRGLSLREACRLQSFPDWFRFSGAPAARSGGLMHQQQQLANAVCPLVTQAIAQFILGL